MPVSRVVGGGELAGEMSGASMLASAAVALRERYVALAVWSRAEGRD